MDVIENVAAPGFWDTLGASAGSISGWAFGLTIVSLVVRSFVKGDIVPRSVLDNVRKDRDDRVLEAVNREKYANENAKIALDTNTTWAHAYDELSDALATVERTMTAIESARVKTTAVADNG